MTDFPIARPMIAPDDKKSDYHRLPERDQTLVDRAILNLITDTTAQGGYVFSADERARSRGNNPTSKEVEWDIKSLRDHYADRLLGKNSASAKQEITRLGSNSPQNATGMLNAINAYNGDECGCKVEKLPPMSNAILNNEIKKGQGR